jgi:hypothetical protein
MVLAAAGCGSSSSIKAAPPSTAAPATTTSVAAPTTAAAGASSTTTGSGTAQSPTTTAAPLALHFEGSGNSAVTVDKPRGIALFTASHTGDGNFAVHSETDASRTSNIVDVSGPYTGTVVIDTLETDKTVRLDVSSNGHWTIDIKAISQVERWDGKSPLVGTSSHVYGIPTLIATVVNTTIAYAGKDNVVVRAWNANGRQDILNHSGPYSVTKKLPKGTFLVEVETGNAVWNISPS